MDHIMTGIEEFLPIYLEEFLDEEVKEKYKHLSDNPLYPELKIIIDSINMYREYLHLPKIKISLVVKQGLERRNKK